VAPSRLRSRAARIVPPPRTDRGALRDLAEHALSRAAGGALVAGNAVQVLRNASANYPAWLAAIDAAQRRIAFENYIIADDDTGRLFAERLLARARAGVAVRVLYDWLGGLGERTRRLCARLADNGVEVRCFNPPRLERPLGWMSRDHRKALVVDGEVAFVSGLCVSDRWRADERRGTPEWRDTGIELRGPAVADVERAFAGVWGATGAPLPPVDVATRDGVAPAGDVAVRVVATEPSQAGLFRLDLLITALARRTLWIADAYFLATSPYVEALRAAARDGVDVRLLVPGTSDLRLVSALSRAGYRPLLEAGIRVFEWNGPMMHAKTAVTDRRWARVGSSNANISSWHGNYELDVTIEDEEVAASMELSYLEDLESSTEVVLRRRHMASATPRRGHQPREGRAGRTAASAIRIGHAVGAALTGQRPLGPAEARVAAVGGLLLVVSAVAAIVWPRLIAIPLGVLGWWLGAGLLLRAVQLARAARAERRERLGQDEAGSASGTSPGGTSAGGTSAGGTSPSGTSPPVP
jgi:cardiolipin synthase